MSQSKQLTEEQILKAKQKEERRLAFEAKRAAELKNKPSNEQVTKSKAELKKETREKQEAQRLAKEQKKLQEQIKTVKQPIKQNEEKSIDEIEHPLNLNLKKNKLIDDKNHEIITRSAKSSPVLNKLKNDQFFTHIPTRETNLNELTKGLGYLNEHIHSSIIKIGLKMNQNLIIDPTNRCISFLIAFKQVILDYEKIDLKKSTSRELEKILDNNVLFLDKCRPLSVSMRNVIRIIKSFILKLTPNLNLNEIKNYLINLIDKFIHEEIECGLEALKEHGNLKINNQDVILVFGNSFLIKHIFKEAKNKNKKFRVIVVDSYPRLDGKLMVEFLNQLEIEVTYVLISALSYVMKEVNKVLLEAHTLLANGYMISDMGSSQIALVAKAHNVPVLICCETYKFSERVHTDSFVFNEADTAKNFLHTHHEKSDLCKLFDNLHIEKQPLNLNILNLYYDVTPRDFISLVITEMGFLPCTATPAIIRRNICKFQLEV